MNSIVLLLIMLVLATYMASGLRSHCRFSKRNIPSIKISNQLITLSIASYASNTILYSSNSVTDINDNANSVILHKGKARLFQSGNPIVYGGAVNSVEGNPNNGDIVIIKDNNNNIIGKGFYNTLSQYRVRVIAMKYEKEFRYDIESILRSRITNAVKLRKALSLPNDSTTVYRLINGEGDKLGGLVIDIIGNNIVVQSSAMWVELHKMTIETILRSYTSGGDTITESYGLRDKKVIWRRAESRLKQDGYSVAEDSSSSSEDTDDELNTVIENDVKYLLSPLNDQKTGFYCDQRESRMMVRSLARGKSVLDCYCYTGGFSLNAVIGGAKFVTGVDSSERAISSAIKNAEINGMDVEKIGIDNSGNINDCNNMISFIQGDAIKVMQNLKDQGKQFDMVICDPPKLAPSRSTLPKAMNKYQKINSLAMQLVNKEHGGLLLTCTCSAAMTQSNSFTSMLLKASRAVGREIAIISISGAAGDHPVLPTYPEGRYLTAVLLYVK